MAGTTINTSTYDYSNDVCVPGDGMDVRNVSHDGSGSGRQADSATRKATVDTVEKQPLPPADYSGKDYGPPTKSEHCADERVRAYTECVKENRAADERECSPGDRSETMYSNGKLHHSPVRKNAKTTTTDGRSVDCRDYSRYGENPETVSRGSSSQNGASHTRGTGSGESKGSGFSGGPFSSNSSSSSSTNSSTATSTSNGSSTSVSEQRPGKVGWEANCQERKTEVYNQCMSE